MASLVSVFERALSARPSSPKSDLSASKPSTSSAAVSEAVVWTLRGIVALQCLGAAWSATLNMSHLGGTLFFEWGFSESLALFVEQVGIWFLIGSAAAVLLTRNRVVPLLVAGYFLLIAAGHTYRGGAAFTDWAIGAHAVRYMAPLALAFLIQPLSVDADRVHKTINWLLRGALAATFLIHGLEALNHHPRFVDYLLVASDKLLGYDLAEPVARRMLTVIGAMDVTLAALVLLARKWRLLLLWMVFWGVVTACSRIVFGGWDKGFMALVRAANGGVALALFFWGATQWTSTSESPNRHQPDRSA